MKKMKKQIIITALLMLSLCSITIAQNTYTAATFKTKIYCDHCSECGSCKARIDKKVLSVKGVKSITLDVKNERIKVVFNPAKTTVKNIKDQINKVGYDADDQKAPKEYVQQLDECCKKN